MLDFKSFTGHFQVIGKLVMLKIQHLIEVLSGLCNSLLSCFYRSTFHLQLLLESVRKYLKMRILFSQDCYLLLLLPPCPLYLLVNNLKVIALLLLPLKRLAQLMQLAPYLLELPLEPFEHALLPPVLVLQPADLPLVQPLPPLPLSEQLRVLRLLHPQFEEQVLQLRVQGQGRGVQQVLW